MGEAFQSIQKAQEWARESSVKDKEREKSEKHYRHTIKKSGFYKPSSLSLWCAQPMAYH